MHIDINTIEKLWQDLKNYLQREYLFNLSLDVQTYNQSSYMTNVKIILFLLFHSFNVVLNYHTKSPPKIYLT